MEKTLSPLVSWSRGLNIITLIGDAKEQKCKHLLEEFSLYVAN